MTTERARRLRFLWSHGFLAILARLGLGPLRTLAGLLDGLSTQEIAERESITSLVNPQRIRNNDPRPLADAIRALSSLP